MYYRLPLATYRVLDLGPGPAAALAARLLGDAGAEVIAVERKPAERTPSFLQLNRDKLACTLDFATPAGASLLHRLVALSDVVVEGCDATERSRLGLDYETLRSIRSDIIVATVRETRAEGTSVSDVVAGTAAASALFVALLHERNTGEGQHIEVDAAQVMKSFGGGASLPSREEALSDRSLRDRLFFEPVAHAREGVVEMPAVPWRLGLTPCHVRLPAPQPGEHSAYVFGGLLGLSDSELAQLQAQGIV